MQRSKLFVSSLALFIIVLFAGSTFAQNENPAFVPNAPFKVGFPIPYSPVPPADTVQGHWSSLAPYAFLDYGVFIYNWPDSNGIYVGGGSDASGVLTANFYFYNIASNTYSPRQPLPATCCLNKMVKIKQKLYVTSTVNNFSAPSGATYEYTPGTGWVTKATMNAPLCHESGIFVYNDSLLFCVGGATSGFSGYLNTVRYFNPSNNTWTTCPSTYPIQVDLTQGECIGNQVVMFAGYNGAGVSSVYRGTVIPGATMDVQWRLEGVIPPNPTGGAPYRECTGIWGNYMLVGPAQSIAGGVEGMLLGFNIVDSTYRRFLPDMNPAAGNMHGIGVQTSPADSVRLYTIGGYTAAASGTNEFSKYAFGAPAPSGVCEQFEGATFPPAGWTMTAGLWSRYNVSGYCEGAWSAQANFYGVSSGTFDLNTLTFGATAPGDSLLFQDAYASFSGENDQLQIMTSSDGGSTYTQLVLLNGGTNGELVTAPPQTAIFVPTCTQWKWQRMALPAGTNKIRFNGISAFGNQLYIDSTCIKFHIVGIANNNTGVPKIYSLSQNYPNPFNPSTDIRFALPKAGVVKLVVYDILGRLVSTPVNEFKQAGNYTINFNAANLASGVYFYRITANDFVETKKMLLVK